MAVGEHWEIAMQMTESRPTPRELAAIEYYEQKGLRGEIDTTPAWVDGFMHSCYADFPPGGLLLDIGCGHGRHVNLLANLCIEPHNYLGVDPAAAQIELGRKLHPECAFEVGNIFTIGDVYRNRFDGFMCFAVLMLFPRHRICEALTSLRASLKTGALGMISTPAGIGEVENVSGLTLTLFEPDRLKRSFERAGFAAEIQLFGHMLLGAIRAI
jgi:SAM-dependent methyltransferase